MDINSKIETRLSELEAVKTNDGYGLFVEESCGFNCGNCASSCDSSCEGSCHRACEDNCSDTCERKQQWL